MVLRARLTRTAVPSWSRPSVRRLVAATWPLSVVWKAACSLGYVGGLRWRVRVGARPERIRGGRFSRFDRFLFVLVEVYLPTMRHAAHHDDARRETRKEASREHSLDHGRPQPTSLSGPRDMRLIADARVPAPRQGEVLIHVAAVEPPRRRERGGGGGAVLGGLPTYWPEREGTSRGAGGRLALSASLRFNTRLRRSPGPSQVEFPETGPVTASPPVACP
jgi:hypothetical protein